jgi:hypothetical protein
LINIPGLVLVFDLVNELLSSSSLLSYFFIRLFLLFNEKTKSTGCTTNNSRSKKQEERNKTKQQKHRTAVSESPAESIEMSVRLAEADVLSTTSPSSVLLSVLASRPLYRLSTSATE